MSKLRIYGVARTRAFRVLWLANELGLDYEHVPIEIGPGGARKADYLAINPNGRLPAIAGAVLLRSDHRKPPRATLPNRRCTPSTCGEITAERSRRGLLASS